MKKLVAGLLFLFFFYTPVSGFAGNSELTILFTGDINGHVEPCG